MSLNQILTLIVTASGGLGIYLLLPRGTMRGRLVGAILAAVALAAVLALWKPVGPTAEKLSFYVLGSTALVGAAMTVSYRNPVYCALSFALVVLSNAGLFALAGAPFLAAGTVIVYAGAIVVTFLFVIMMAQQQGLAIYDRLSREPLLATLTSFVLVWSLLTVFLRATADVPPDQTLLAIPEAVQKATPASTRITPDHHVAGLGVAITSDHLISLEIAGTLLLVAMVGAVVIAGRSPRSQRKT